MTRPQKRLLVGVLLAVGSGGVWFAFGFLAFAAFALLVVLSLGAWEVLGRRGEDEPKVDARSSLGVGLLLPLGLGLLFIAERVVGEGHDTQAWWRGLSLACFAALAAWRGYELSRSRGNQRKVELRLTLATAGVLLALGLYALSTEGGIAALGLEGSAAERASGALSALWPAVLVVSLGALLFMQMAYRRMPIEEAIELRRVVAAAQNGLALTLSLVFVVSINYVASERDVKRDLSYFKTSRASETTEQIVAELSEPVEVVLFYPAVHEVLEQLKAYFEPLAASSDELTVTVRDHALAPELAREHRVRGNGHVLILRGEGEGQQAETFEVGTTLESARRRLRTLDGTFQQHLAQLTTRPRDLFMTAGHAERSAGAGSDPAEQRLGELAAALSRANIERRDLGLAQGLGDRVPEDARAVAVVGPREPFLPEEVDSLRRYVAEGGRLMIFVDPAVEHGLEPLLRGLGVQLRQGVLHSERYHIRRREPPADRQVVLSNAYSAHPTVTLANRYRSRVASIFERGGALERYEGDEALEGVSVTFPLRTAEGFWLDLDDDHQQDEGEPSGDRFQMMAASVVPNEGGDEGRAVIVADGDFITDAWIGNRGNAFVLMDVLNWLVGEDRILGPTQSEEDVPIQHTRDEDKAWFYGTSFGAPLPLLLAGVWIAVRRRRGGRRQEPRRASPRGAAAPGGGDPVPAPAALALGGETVAAEGEAEHEHDDDGELEDDPSAGAEARVDSERSSSPGEGPADGDGDGGLEDETSAGAEARVDSERSLSPGAGPQDADGRDDDGRDDDGEAKP